MDQSRKPGRDLNVRILERVAELLDDARLARQSGDFKALRALTSAVLALDPDNAEAEALLVGSARRRQMTLMFCDIVGSTAIADGRDPEEMSRILRAYRAVCTEVVERYEGFIDDHQGDGMLVLFGYPDVQEDDPCRAVLCGLEIVKAISERMGNGADGAVALHVRIAVHTDLVVLDGVGVAGATVNEAARIQNLARPDTVVISDMTEAIVRGWFDAESLGQVELRGVSRPVEVFTVLRERPTGRRESGTAPSPFTDRRPELEQIAALWQATCSGWEAAADGREVASLAALLVTGPPGIGKTRLLAEGARAVGAPCAECRCSRYQDNTSLYPFRGDIEDACGVVSSDDVDSRLAKLRARLGVEREPDGDLPFLAATLQIPPSALSPPPEVDPRKLRTTALQAAARLVRSRSADSPSMVLVDDVHWADQSTLDLLLVLLTTPHPGLMIVLTAREGFEPPWPQPMVTTLRLEPLAGSDLQELACRIPESSRLSEAQRAELISRSDGMPLFLEELIRTAEALDRNRVLHRSIRYADYHIPAALRDPLLARLASPEVDLDLAQTAATIGRDVDRNLLRRVAGLSGAALQTRLQTLVVADLVEPLEGDVIRFRHELIREIAYETQPRAVLRDRHSRIADHLLEGSADASRIDAGQVAFHLEGAHRYQEAIRVHLRAARADQEIGAHAEATRRLTETLQLLDRLPHGAPREQAELMVRELRSFSAVMAGGYAAPEAAEDHRRCVELCEQVGLRPEILPSLIRSWSYYAFHGQLAEADRVNDRMEHVIGSGVLGFPVVWVLRGVIGFFQGRFTEARRVMETFVDQPWGTTEQRPPPEWPLPNDPLVSVCAHLVPTLWIGGEPAAAESMGDRALRRASSLEFPYGPFSVGYVKSLLAMTRRLDGDHEGAARLAGELIQLGERHGFALWGLAGAIQQGISAVHEGTPAALDRLAEDVSAWRLLLAADVWSPYWLTELAVAQRTVGRVDAAVRSLDEAIGIATATGTSFYAAETLRIRGEVRRDRGEEGGVADIERAVELASRQGATAFAARARASLERVAVR